MGTEERTSTSTWILEEERDAAKGKFLTEEIPNSLQYVRCKKDGEDGKARGFVVRWVYRRTAV